MAGVPSIAMVGLSDDSQQDLFKEVDSNFSEFASVVSRGVDTDFFESMQG